MKIVVFLTLLATTLMAEEGWRCQTWSGTETSRLERADVTPALDSAGKGSRVTDLRAYGKYQFCIKGGGSLQLIRKMPEDTVMVTVSGGSTSTQVTAYGIDRR